MRRVQILKTLGLSQPSPRAECVNMNDVGDSKDNNLSFARRISSIFALSLSMLLKVRREEKYAPRTSSGCLLFQSGRLVFSLSKS